MKMRKKDKEIWVKALRSGEYKQGRKKLYNEKTDSYCCLGVCYDVLCDGDWVRVEEGHWGVPGYEDGINCGSLDGYTFRPRGLSLDSITGLIMLNDIACKTFGQIADYIEEKL